MFSNKLRDAVKNSEARHVEVMDAECKRFIEWLEKSLMNVATRPKPLTAVILEYPFEFQTKLKEWCKAEGVYRKPTAQLMMHQANIQEKYETIKYESSVVTEHSRSIHGVRLSWNG